MEILDKDESYLIGLIQTDGHLQKSTRNRGKLQIELNIRDRDILFKIAENLRVNYSIKERKRTTNFGYSHTICLSVFDQNYRRYLVENGVPEGRKSQIIKPPAKKFCEVDYIRGLYDGDGSLGITEKGFPFLSIVTSSDDIKDYLISFIAKTLNKPAKTMNKNKRDNVYNICILNEDAVNIVKILYYENCLGIDRKKEKAQEVIKWVRPDSSKKRATVFKKWSAYEDEVVLNNNITKASEILNRSYRSVSCRRFKINGKRS